MQSKLPSCMILICCRWGKPTAVCRGANLVPGETATKTNRDEDGRVVTSSDNIGGMNFTYSGGRDIRKHNTSEWEREEQRTEKTNIGRGKWKRTTIIFIWCCKSMWPFHLCQCSLSVAREISIMQLISGTARKNKSVLPWLSFISLKTTLPLTLSCCFSAPCSHYSDFVLCRQVEEAHKWKWWKPTSGLCQTASGCSDTRTQYINAP